MSRKGRGHPSNEDRWVTCEIAPQQSWATSAPVHLFVVLDGHGGPGISEYLSKQVQTEPPPRVCSAHTMHVAVQFESALADSLATGDQMTDVLKQT